MKFRSFLFMAALVVTNASYADQIVLITNKANPVSVVSARDAKNIFLGKKSKWDHGATIMSYTQADEGVTEAFAQQYMSQSAKQFSLYWRKAIFTGTGTPPAQVSDSASMKQMIAANAGSLGYILESELDDTVSVVKVN